MKNLNPSACSGPTSIIPRTALRGAILLTGYLGPRLRALIP
jgi:hypothetical protein